jgi:hypothetical protein
MRHLEYPDDFRDLGADIISQLIAYHK